MLNGIVINNQYVTNATTYSVEMLILSFIYGLLLTLLFFRKKKVKTSEIRLFGILIIICMMATFTELMLFVSAACVRPESFLENLVYKFYIIIADTFSLFFLRLYSPINNPTNVFPLPVRNSNATVFLSAFSMYKFSMAAW